MVMRTKEFSFEVFNKDVRASLQENVDHPEYSGFWGSRRCFSIQAESTQEAKKKIRKKYPEEKGFVITLK